MSHDWSKAIYDALSTSALVKPESDGGETLPYSETLPYIQAIQAIIDDAIARDRLILERVCAQAAEDGEERGVLVVQKDGRVESAELSPYVPKLTCYYVNKDALGAFWDRPENAPRLRFDGPDTGRVYRTNTM